VKKSGNKLSFGLKVVLGIGILAVLGFGYILEEAYRYIYKPNVVTTLHEADYILIPTGSSIEDVTQLLYEKGVIVNRSTFEWLARKMKYAEHVYPGRYRITNGMSNHDLIEMLRTGKQDPVKLVFNPMRGVDHLGGVVAKQIEVDSVSLDRMLNDPDVAAQYGFSLATFPSMFIPNTYEFFWNTSAEKFINRMHKEYEHFWNDARKAKAKRLDLSPVEVVTLASIVEEETVKGSEKSRIAGVYRNRLRKGMMLQADPTVKFAIGDFTIRRILNKQLQVNSPYNTYRFAGLPPGPINYPSPSTVDAVLNAEKHSYLYFCAREDFSGYHNFSTTLKEHNKNAAAYRRALSRQGIYK